MKNGEKWYVYILICADRTYYTGITLDTHRRVKEHNFTDSKAARYTKIRRPVKLVYSEIAANRSEAAKREIFIKKLKKSDKKKLIDSLNRVK